MKELKKNLKNYLLAKYAEKKIANINSNITSNIPWIKKKHLSNTINTHCLVLLDSLLEKECELSFREKKFLFDKIMKYSIQKGESVLKANGKVKIIKPLLRLNSFIVYDEVIKGLLEKKSRKSILFNIEKQLLQIQEKIDSDIDAEEILQEKISA